MGLLDDVFDGFGGTGFGAPKFLRNNLRAGEKLLTEGEPANARITGIRVRRVADNSPDQHEFALEFTGSGATTVRAGCRVRLASLPADIRLGMEVPVRHDGERAIIDVPALGGDEAEDAAWGYKRLDPPAAGIADDNFDLEKERRKADPAVATVLSATPCEVFGMRMQNVDVRVRVAPAGGAEPYETVVKRDLLPFYATHLAEPGTALPALVRRGRPDKVRIDWPAAAVAVPGVGRPAAVALAAPPPPAEPAVTTSAGSTDWSPAGLAADDHGEVEGVDLATWVAVEVGLVRDRVKPDQYAAYAEQHHGVAPGTWNAARAGWQRKMQRDPRLGARFGAEYGAAMKRR